MARTTTASRPDRLHRDVGLPAAIGRIVAVLAVAVAVSLAACGAAAAHAALIGSEPADGAVMAVPPTALRLLFNEPASPLVLRLVRPDGGSAPLTGYALRGAALDITLPPQLGPGTHVLSWRVVSEDGHPVGGSLVFSVGAPGGSAAAGMAAVDWPLRVAIWSARLALYAGLFLGIGGAVFRAWIAPGTDRGRTVAAAAMLLGLVAAPLSVGLLGLDGLEMPLGGLVQPLAWRSGFGTSYGTTAAIAVAALCAGLGSLLLRGKAAARGLSAVALFGLGSALAASGHASAAAPQWLTRPAVFAHAVAIAVWIGALVPLGSMLARREPQAAPALRRFSAVIPLALAPLLAAGVILAIIQVEEPGALLATAYGRVLLVKLLLVALLLALAARNRWRLTGPAEHGDGRASRRLAQAIGAEIVLVLAILGTVALWRFTPPPRALAAAAAEPVAIHIHTLPAMADLSISPGRMGPVTASIVIMTGDFGALDAKAVTLVLANPAAGIEPIRRAARKPGDGTWQVDGLVIPAAGTWTVRIDILVSDFDLVSLTGEVRIRP